VNDGYAVTVTGSDTAVARFASWYRSVIPTEHPLFIYGWCYSMVRLEAGMSADTIAEQLSW
jgi:hypothetical protein